MIPENKKISLPDFYRGKKVLITGNTGFKGSWLTRILIDAGAEVMGYSLQPNTDPNLYEMAGLSDDAGHKQIIADVRDLDTLKKVFSEFEPEIVFHLAAQPIVRESYRDPVGTFETNIMGTVNVLECVRLTDSVRSFLNVTTDKVYLNRELDYGYKETDPLDGYDPYSNSKSCSELVTHSYNSSFFKDREISISTARAGNVIGGGDFSADRIIPDCVRSVLDASKRGDDQADIIVRNPNSIRPYQHVLEPLFAYLMIAAYQYDDKEYAGWYNVGPDDRDCVNTGRLVGIFCDKWNEGRGERPEVSWQHVGEANAPHEANFLKLDCNKLKETFGWNPRWDIETAVEKTADFTRVLMDGRNIVEEMRKEIREMLGQEHE